MNKKVSIVICTYNRAPFLKRTLHSLKNLEYKEFEVVVINGPSIDDTVQVLERYKDTIKIGNNPYANLSISRNMGIALSGGDIVAFIDDDAIPDRKWLDDIVSVYENPKVGGAGGKVYGPGDDHFQFENGYVDFWGEADVHYHGPDYNEPNGNKFNMMLGTNCTFLKKVLLEVGGFDEYYEYFHDESDLCLRVVQAGYHIINHEHAYIHHEFAKSHIRENTFDGCRLNWYPIVKNKTYFAIKNSEGKATDKEREAKLREIEQQHLNYYKMWLKEKKITKEECEKFTELCKSGFLKGCKDGYNKPREFNFEMDKETPFKKYNFDLNTGAISICILCRDNVMSAVGGVAKYSYELAKGFVKEGHLVHIITEGQEDMDWMQEGISFHSIKMKNQLDFPELSRFETTMENLQYAYLVYKRVQKISGKYGIDVIESALWNFEGAVVAHMFKQILPVLVRLQTPLLKVCETQNWKITEDLELFADFEREMIQEADGVIAISDNIKETITQLYNINFEKQKTSKVYLGIDKIEVEKSRENDEKIQILFVGRLERRKGIHTIFEVIPKIMKEYSNVEFRFVGNDDSKDEKLKESYKSYFQNNFRKEKWTKNVIFLGQITNKEKDQEFANCDIFIAPSLYESFGIILIEAMSAKKPVIGCKIGGMQEIIIDNENGYLIEVENDKELYTRLKRLIDNKELRKKMGENGFDYFEKKFANRIMIEDTINVYKKHIKDFIRY